MKEKIIRIPVLILLTALNLFLMFQYLKEQKQNYQVSDAEMDRVIELYEESGLTFRTRPSGQIREHVSLQLENADLDSMVLSYLGDADYDLTYIYGAKTQYNSGTEVLTADWENHSILYRDTSVQEDGEDQDSVLSEEEQQMLETVALRFAQEWLGEEVVTTGWSRSEGTLTVRFAQLADDCIYFFNSVSVVVLREGVQSAEVTCWKVSGEAEEVLAMPMDEMLYRGLEEIRSSSLSAGMLSDGTGLPGSGISQTKNSVVTSLMDGYRIETESGDRAVAMPTLTIVLNSGKMVTLNYCSD